MSARDGSGEQRGGENKEKGKTTLGSRSLPIQATLKPDPNTS